MVTSDQSGRLRLSDMGDVAALTWPLYRPSGALYMPPGGPRRCLFGPVDHDKLKSQLDEHMDKLFEQDKLKWNFDFRSDRPLPTGRYAWEKIGDPTDTNSSSDTQKIEEMQKDEEKPKKQEQTQITDFMRKRKSSNQKEPLTRRRPKTRRRSST